MRTVCGRCNGSGKGTSISGSSYACDTCCGCGYLGSDDDIPAKEINLIDQEKWLRRVEKQLDDTEFYSPTTPLPYQTYHDIIRRLMTEIRKPVFHGDYI